VSRERKGVEKATPPLRSRLRCLRPSILTLLAMRATLRC
jgi:hypothetical protein